MNRKKEIQEPERSNASGLIQKLNDKEKELEGLKRELEIEAALERVRSRTLAMHKSDELAETAAVLFEQVKGLGAAPERMNIGIVKEEKGFIEFWPTEQGGKQINQLYKGSINEPTTLSKAYNAWKTGKRSIVIELKGKKLSDWLNYNREEVGLPFKKDLIQKRRVHTISFFSQGMIIMSTPEPLASEAIDLLERFAGVFKLTYTRFLDLQKAEAQVREAQIEAALERVRARSMAMHSSEELSEVAYVLFEKLKELGVQLRWCWFSIFDEDLKGMKAWYTDTDGQFNSTPIHQKIKDFKDVRSVFKAWKDNDPICLHEIKGPALVAYVNELGKNQVFRKGPTYRTFKKNISGCLYQTHAIFKQGYIGYSSFKPRKNETLQFIGRFAKSFEQTYTRFLDLQKVEAQAREAQIEAALERVRSKSIGMQKSEELKEVIRIIFDQLALLDINAEHAGIVVDYKAKQDWNFWIAETQDIPSRITIPYLDSLWDRQYVEAKEKGKDFFATQFNFEEKNRFYQELLKYIPGLTKKTRNFYLNCPGLAISTVIQDNIGLYIENFSGTPYSDDENNILMRFGKVFQQTYTRFLDLQKAEEQAREAQIEAGLERVRASTMAMHKSEQLSETAMVLFDQFYQLGQVPDRISIAIFNPLKKCFEFRVTDQSGSQLLSSYNATIEESTTIHKIYKAWKNKEKSTVIKLTGQSLKKWIQFVKEEMKLHIDEKKIQGQRIHHAAFFSHGFLLYTSSTYMESEFINLLVRFASVFDQTYTRFLDLKKAETQAREAQIEAALERVRAQAMAMQRSEDLIKSTSVLLEELEHLQLSVLRCGIGIVDPDTFHAKIYSTSRADKGEKSIATGEVDLNSIPAWRGTIEAWKNQELQTYVLEGEELKEYYIQLTKGGFKLPEKVQESISLMHRQYYYNALFPQGGLYFFSESPVSRENLRIIQRFADVYHLTYTRYEDLQKAEYRTLEAVRQASLDRVRGEIASMRSKEDLRRITPLIWKELTTLGVPFIRCGVFIMDVEKEIIQSYLSTPDGKALGIFNLPFTSELIGELMVDFWEKGKIYKEHWTKARFIEFMHRLKETGQLKDTDSYQGAAAPPDKLDLHFIPFKQGMLYVGNTEPLTKDELELVRSLAETFSIAYARYEDFKGLEMAKNQIETTLNELKSTQSQLIHAEKMASLGELTAGIAHEIQNPLNFVNNFSEVSVDLIEELKVERGKVESERENSLEEEILDDVIQNLEKINHHGQRASSIVKGMLEHSRTGSKDKQLTDINALADEYLRLAYHGLRAKDKSFNADFKLEVEEKLPKIKVFPQEIGRVLLNLINNAFYAVSKKAKTGIQNYKPRVIILTRKINYQIEIRVKDNGSGIPDEIKEKIFQPFFTTKPTGSGTGLGLSLSYDIIKAHGGDVKVVSKKGDGSEFIINIPIDL